MRASARQRTVRLAISAIGLESVKRKRKIVAKTPNTSCAVHGMPSAHTTPATISRPQCNTLTHAVPFLYLKNGVGDDAVAEVVRVAAVVVHLPAHAIAHAAQLICMPASCRCASASVYDCVPTLLISRTHLLVRPCARLHARWSARVCVAGTPSRASRRWRPARRCRGSPPFRGGQ